jgi:hypothetical protein
VLWVLLEVTTMTKYGVVGLAALVMAACGGGAGDQGERAEAAGFTPQASDHWIAGTVTSSSAEHALLSSSDVCLWNPNGIRCATTSPVGRYEVEAATDEPISMLVEKAGYAGARIDMREPLLPLFADVLLLSDADASSFAEAAGRRYEPASTGGILVVVNAVAYDRSIPLSGATVSLRTVAETAVVYADEAGRPDATASTTSAAGWAAAIGMPPGPVTIDVKAADPGAVCATYWDGYRGLDQPIDATVDTGRITTILVGCVPEDLVLR